MFSIVTFYYRHFCKLPFAATIYAKIISSDNYKQKLTVTTIPFVKNKDRNVLNVKHHIYNFVRLCSNNNKKHDIQKRKKHEKEFFLQTLKNMLFKLSLKT